MSIELATAYVSLVAETTKLEKGVQDALNGVGRKADAAGADMGTRLAKTASKALKDGWRPDQDIMAGIPNTKLDRVGARIGQVIGKGVATGIKAQQLGRDFGNSFASGAGSVGIGSVISNWRSDLQGQSNKLGFLAGKALSAGVTAAVGVGVAGVGLALTKGFDRLVTLDTAQNKLKALMRTAGRDTKEVGQIIQDVTDVVSGTPFSLDSAFNTAVQAIGAGAKDIKSFMKDVADAAGFAGTDIDRMGLIFNQVLAKGKLTGEETMQLMEAGVPARSWIQKSWQLTNEQFDDMQEKGLITLDMLRKAIRDNAGGMAQELGNTLQGSIDNMQTAIARTGANFLSAIFGGPTGDATEGLKSAVQRVTELLNDLNTWIVNNKDNIKNFFTEAKDAAVILIDVLGDISAFLIDFPGLIQTIAVGFGGWQAIKLAGLIAQLGTVSGLLGGMTGPIGMLLALGTGAYLIGTAGDSQFPGQTTPTDPTGERGLQNRATGTSIMGVPSAVNDPIFAGTPDGPNIPGGGGPNASRERRGLPPVSTGLLGGGFVGNEQNPGGMPGTAGQGYMNSAKASAALDWKNVDALAGNNGLTMTSGYRDPNGPTLGGVPAWRSYHGSGRARDYAGTPAQMAAFYNLMKATYGSQLKELLHEDIGTPNEHVHVAYDTGGWLPPGATTVQNDTGKPELILNPEQVKALADQGIDPNSLLHGTANAAAPGPTAGQAPQTNLDTTNRTGGFVPVAAGNTGVAGTSFVSGVLNLGNEAVSGAIDAGAQLAQMAASAAIAGGTMGAGAAAGPAAAPAASAGIQIAANIAKRASAYGFQLAGIGADSLIAQLFPFGAPRWLGYDYTAFTPQMTMGDFGVTTGEKAANQAQGQAVAPGQDAGGPVQPALMPGASQPITDQPHMGGGMMPGPAAMGPAPIQPPDPQSDLLNRIMGYDQGGMLPPGGIGINMTNRPEPVLTPQQWDSINSVGGPGSQGPLVKIDAIYGISPDDVANKIESKQKLAMMRYAGRP